MHLYISIPGLSFLMVLLYEGFILLSRRRFLHSSPKWGGCFLNVYPSTARYLAGTISMVGTGKM